VCVLAKVKFEDIHTYICILYFVSFRFMHRCVCMPVDRQSPGHKQFHFWILEICSLSVFFMQVLKGDASNLSGILEQGRFDYNYKAVSKAYEEYVLSEGDFDERIFLGKRFSF